MITKMTSKDYLTKSALELFSANPIEKVSVKNIAENCGLSTRTFYKYYKDKYDIINNCFEKELEIFFSDAGKTIGLYDFLVYTADIICSQVPFFANVFLYTGQNNIRLGLEAPIRKQYIRIIQDYFHEEVTLDLYNAITFFIKGQLAYVEEALRLPNIPSAQDSTAFFINAMPFCLLKFLYGLPQKELSAPLSLTGEISSEK